METPALDARISDRVDLMWAAGLLDEVRILEAQGIREGRTASAALGYKQLLSHFEGLCTEGEAQAETVRDAAELARGGDVEVAAVAR
jgi:tRNA dimethylallyltransferase